MSAAWIAVDWGTTHLRAWLMDAQNAVIEARSSSEGMGSLTADAYEAALLALVGDAVTGPCPVVVCGMAGSRQGWREAPYAAVPCAPPDATGAQRVETQDARFEVHILPGIKQDKPADVMRGEETQIAGFLATHAGFDGVICLPGTHTKWAHVSAGEVVSFQTFMTGEMFALLAEASVLKHSVARTGWDDAAFAEAVSDAMSRPAAVAAKLFGLRAQGLLHGENEATARAQLSGLLIGMELAAARPYWLGQQVAMIGADAVAGPYEAALGAQGVPVIRAQAAEMTLAGLCAARVGLEKT